MRKIYELIADIRAAYPNEDFFADFQNVCRKEPSKAKHFRSYNDALMTLDAESWSVLKNKALQHYMDEREGQRKEAFFNHLNEAFAYRYLFRKRFKAIRFIEEGRRKSPDIRFTDRGTESYCEVKTLGISDNEIDRRKGQSIYDGAVYFGLSEGFLKKLSEDIGQAWKQIHSSGTNGLVFVLIRFDDIALDYYQRYRDQIAAFSRERGFKNLILKVGHRGNRRICLN